MNQLTTWTANKARLVHVAIRHTHRTSGRSHHCLTSRQNAQARSPTPPETSPGRGPFASVSDRPLPRPCAPPCRPPSASKLHRALPARIRSPAIRTALQNFLLRVSFRLPHGCCPAFRAPEKKNPAPILFRLPGFSLGRSGFDYESSPLGLARLSSALPAGRAASPHACERRREAKASAVCVMCVMRSRLLSSRPARAECARPKAIVSSPRAGTVRRGCNRNRPSNSSAVSPGGMSSGRVRLLRRGYAGLRRRQ
jgi:hypothetical protein